MEKANAPNWKKIKSEYIKGNISQRKIAEKYGVAISTLTRRATLEGWKKKRDECERKADAKLVQKIAEKQSDIMSQMAELHDSACLLAITKLLKQLQEFPDSTATTKIVRETVRMQVVEDDNGKEKKIPLKSTIESDLSETVKNLISLSRDLGLDAASKLASQKAKVDKGLDQISDGGFVEALDEVRPNAWDVSDVPLNITDTDGVDGDDE